MKNNGNSLRNFQVKQKLGSGSYGVIFKAINKTDKSVCVLKQVNLGRMSERAKQNAVNEATIMGKLKHPFIVSYCESFTEDRNLNIIMEYCDSGDLSQYLKQQNKKYLKEAKIWMFFIQICMGLEYIHKNKILHRDIKTLNIFLHQNQMVKIGDLGVAKMLNSNDFAHTMVGTPFYLSPELCEEKPYNQKSDIWAMGCLLYELCTFRHPFEAANQASLILKIIRGKYSPIPQFYSVQLRQMIDWCLERDYKRRPTANMILSKPYVKKMIEQFQYQKIVDEFGRKKTEVTTNPPKTVQVPTYPPKTVQGNQRPKKSSQKNINAEKARPQSSQRPVQKPPVAKVIDSPHPNVILPNVIMPNVILPNVIMPNVILPKPAQAHLPPKKPIQKVLDEPKIGIKIEKKQSKEQTENQELIYKRKSVKVIKQVEENRPKVLFGGQMPENKAEFAQNLEIKLQAEKVQRKPPTYFQIPWNNDYPKSQLEKRESQGEDRVIIHNKNALFQKQTPVKHTEPVQRIKMQKKVEPKVYQIKADRPKGIIKSGGFQQQQVIPMSERKKSQIRNSNEKIPTQVKEPESRKQVKPTGVSNSMRNLRKQPEEKPSYLPKKRDSNPGMIPHYPPRTKKHSNMEQPQHGRPPRHVPHEVRGSSSRFTEVSKQEQELVQNLPDIVQTLNDSDDSDVDKAPVKEDKFKLNEVDHDIVLRKYEQMIDSASQWKAKSTQNDEQGINDNQSEQRPVEQIEINQSQAFWEQVDEQLQNGDEQFENGDEENEQGSQEQFQEQFQEGDDRFYEVNKFKVEDSQYGSKIADKKEEDEWQYDEEPELPLMQEAEMPFFQEVNPYLADQRTEEESLQDKKLHLQMKLKENIKREDQINKLMQLKIEECKSVVPKGFEEILSFFRSKINMDREYTDDDEKEVEVFLSRRNLTDQRKFQNIYKIMHFEMELENTRRIIQSICKKLNELEDV